MRRFEKLGFSIFFVHCKQCIWLYMPFLLCKYAYFHYVEYLVNIYPSRNVVSNCTIFCVYSIRDGYTKWVRYRIIVELQLFSFQYCWLSMLGIVEERWESCLFFSSVFKGQILSVNVILTRSNLVPIRNKTVLANGLKQHN